MLWLVLNNNTIGLFEKLLYIYIILYKINVYNIVLYIIMQVYIHCVN